MYACAIRKCHLPAFFVKCVFISALCFFVTCFHRLNYSRFQVTAVHPVREGQCIALGYESVLPLVLLTLQGGDIKPYKFPNEGTKAIAGSGKDTSIFPFQEIFLSSVEAKT